MKTLVDILGSAATRRLIAAWGADAAARASAAGQGITHIDLARQLCVSPSAVSRALSGQRPGGAPAAELRRLLVGEVPPT